MELLPENNSEYGTLKYWEERYQNEDGKTFDWFKGFGDIASELEQLIDRKDRILHLGCGNSTLAEDMYRNGYQQIVNVDYSPKVIDFMRQRTIELEKMEWIVGDIFQLDQCFPILETFDIALDKGTLDALLTVKHDPWNPHKELLNQIESYVKQVAQQIRKGGKFLHITFAQPHFRRRFFEIPEFKVNVHKLGTNNGGFEYFCYEAIKL